MMAVDGWHCMCLRFLPSAMNSLSARVVIRSVNKAKAVLKAEHVCFARNSGLLSA